MRDDFLTFKEYYRQAVDKVAADSFYQQTINHKFKHSVEVLHIGQTILTQTPELLKQPQKFKKFAEKALLFHDVGRFEEAVCQYIAQQKDITVAASSNFYDHGLLGYDLLSQNPDYNDPRILFAIKWHGKMTADIIASDDWQKAMKSPDFTAIKNILFLVRDADKLANLYHIKNDNHLTRDLFYHQLTDTALHAPVSEKVWHQFYHQKAILFPTVYSFADRILMVISWVFDLNYQKTRELFNQHQYLEFLLDFLAQYHSYPEDIKKIRHFIAENT